MTENKLERKPRFIDTIIKTKKEKKRNEPNAPIQEQTSAISTASLACSRTACPGPRTCPKRTESEHVTQSNSH